MDICTACGASIDQHHQNCRQGAGAPVPRVSLTSDEFPDHTRTAFAGLTDSEAPVLVMDDGQRIGLSAPIILGRAPRREPGARSIAVNDAQRTMSKTHLRIEGFGPGVTVTDLNSTNGVRVRLPDGRDLRLVPGAPTMLMAGAEIQMGERSFLIADAMTDPRPVGAATHAVAPPQTAPVSTESHAQPRDTASLQTPVAASAPLRTAPRSVVMNENRPSGRTAVGLMPADRPDAVSAATTSASPHEAAARIEAHLHAAARATCAQLEPAFGVVAASAIAQAVAAVSSRRVTVDGALKPGLIPAFVLERTDGLLLGEGARDRLRRANTHAAVLVGLRNDVSLAFSSREGQAHIWMARDGISRVSRVTAKRRFTTFRAVEWRYDGQWLKDPDVVLERVMAFCPKPDSSGVGDAWQARVRTVLTSQPSSV